MLLKQLDFLEFQHILVLIRGISTVVMSRCYREVVLILLYTVWSIIVNIGNCMYLVMDTQKYAAKAWVIAYAFDIVCWDLCIIFIIFYAYTKVITVTPQEPQELNYIRGLIVLALLSIFVAVTTLVYVRTNVIGFDYIDLRVTIAFTVVSIIINFGMLWLIYKIHTIVNRRARVSAEVSIQLTDVQVSLSESNTNINVSSDLN